MKLLVSTRFAPCSSSDHPRHLIREDTRTFYEGRPWYASYREGCWVNGGRGATLQLGHDEHDLGRIGVVIARDGWFFADAMIDLEDGDPLAPIVREQVRVGAPVSVGCRSISRREWPDRMGVGSLVHMTAKLEHVAVLDRDGLAGVPGFAGARVTAVRELPAHTKPVLKTKPVTAPADWHRLLPPGYETWREDHFDLEAGTELFLGSGGHGIVWNGKRFTASRRRIPSAA